MTPIVTVGIVGTSWWADAMYLPALREHPQAEVTAICGRERERAEKMARRWYIPHVFQNARAMFESGLCQAVVIATRNDSHYPISIQALEANLHVLCEKPLALEYPQAAHMAALAEKKGLKHMTPFTYRFMPAARYLKDLIEQGYLGQPYHLNMRYYASYGRNDDYLWRFDTGIAGSGVLGDLGSHFLYLADWYFGKISGVSCQLGRYRARSDRDPQGKPFTPGDETALLLMTFTSGAQGAIHLTTLAYEDTPFGQTHAMEFHGSGGTLNYFNDWDTRQEVSGARQGEGAVKRIPIPERFWGGAPRTPVHETYKHVFRQQNHMTRGWINTILEDTPASPDFHDGARVQRYLAAALRSDREKRWVAVESIRSNDEH